MSRSTVYRWIQSDPQFKAAYNLWQQELAESARARLLKMSDKAVDVVEAALNRKEERVAMQMLSKLGVMRPLQRKSTDPEVLRMQIELKQQREMYLAVTAMLKHLLEKAGLDPKQQDEYLRTHGARTPAAGLARALQGPLASDSPEAQGLTQAELENLDLQAVAQAMADRELEELDAQDPLRDGAHRMEHGAPEAAPRRGDEPAEAQASAAH